MDIWNVARVMRYLMDRQVGDEREASNLARWIWEDVLHKTMGQDAALSESTIAELKEVVHRIQDGEPIQYIAGHAWFYGKQFVVTPDVLIPRPETEELVEWIMSTCGKGNDPVRVLDLGTGSGCIAIMLGILLGSRAEILAIDISDKALVVAEENNRRLSGGVTFIRHDFLRNGFQGLGEFDLIASNPPYISRDSVEPEILAGLRFEPDIALFPEGEDPDVFYKKIIEEAGGALREDGYCFLEINEFRKERLNDLLCRSTAWTGITFRRDLQGKWRMLRIKKQ